MTGLSHIGASGEANMVDVSDKPVTHRTATAEARISANARTIKAITDGDMPKGDVLGTARLAGIMAAKKTSDLIPLCHPLPVSKVEVTIAPTGDTEITVTASVKTAAQTGVEMEALTAVSIAALTLYDMAKAVDKAIVIRDTRLIIKTGGKSGDYHAAETAAHSPNQIPEN